MQFAFGGDHRDRGCRLVAPHGLAGVDPGGLADAELLAKSIRGVDNVNPARRDGKDVGLQLGRDIENELRCDGRKRLL